LTNRPRTSGRADLHVHTTCSDGCYTPAEVVDLARRSGLAALAITDHDTLDGIAAAEAAASGSSLEIVPGVEITAEHEGREFHLLGYYVRQDDLPLRSGLGRLRDHRVGRYWDMVERLRGFGVSLDEQALRNQAERGVLSRRHLALLIVKAGKAGSLREAFQRFLGDNGRVVVPKLRLPVAEAIRLVRDAGGVTSWAHPSNRCTRETLQELSALGLQAVEAYYPTFKNKWVRQLKSWAEELDLGVTGGSDCHGPGRELGRCSLTVDELDDIRQMVIR